MRLVSFEQGGIHGVGLMRDDEAFVSLTTGSPGGASLKAVLALPEAERATLLEEAARRKPTHRLADVNLLPPVPDAQAIWALALNYTEHAKESLNSTPGAPALFLRLPGSLVGHNRPLEKPRCTTQFDYEGELAVVIGSPGRNIPREKAMEHVAGYASCNDGSVRNWQKRTSQITAGKNFANSGSVGPWMVTPDELGDIYDATLTTRLNGQVVQQTKLGAMLFKIDEIIADISQIMPLLPGDMILTGTPSGVGFRRNPQLFMVHGDRVEVEIEGVGLLGNPVVEANA